MQITVEKNANVLESRIFISINILYNILLSFFPLLLYVGTKEDVRIGILRRYNIHQ